MIKQQVLFRDVKLRLRLLKRNMDKNQNNMIMILMNRKTKKLQVNNFL